MLCSQNGVKPFSSFTIHNPLLLSAIYEKNIHSKIPPFVWRNPFKTELNDLND